MWDLSTKASAPRQATFWPKIAAYVEPAGRPPTEPRTRDSRTVITAASVGGPVEIIDVESRVPRQTISLRDSSQVPWVELAHDGQTLLVAELLSVEPPSYWVELLTKFLPKSEMGAIRLALGVLLVAVRAGWRRLRRRPDQRNPAANTARLAEGDVSK